MVPIDFLDLLGAGQFSLYARDYQIPIANATQVFNNLNARATAIDLAERTCPVVRWTFFPPNYQYAYGSLRGGGYAVFDTDYDQAEVSAQTDLIITSSASNAVHFYQGITDGAAQFLPRGLQFLPQKPDSIASGDFDHDGDLDLAVADTASTKVSILLGNGDVGTVSFQPATNVDVGQAPGAVAAADLDGDKDVDVAAILGTDTSLNCTVAVLNGVGNGTFTSS